MTATTTPMISGRHLDVLLWVQDGHVSSDAPTAVSPVRLRRPNATTRCITALFAPVAHAELVERAPGGTKWRLTGDGLAVLDAAAVWLLVDEAAIAGDPKRRTSDWWTDHCRTATDLTRDTDGTVRIRCASRVHAQRWIELMVANGVPKTALRIEASS